MNRIPLLVPRMPLTESLVPYLRKIDQNQWYTNFGPLNSELENRLVNDTATGFDEKNITTVANCTVGLELNLQAFQLKPNSRVLIPSITFVATATAVIRAGMIPVLADVDPDTWVLTPELVRRAVSTSAVDAVMPVATFGFAHDMQQWDDLSVDLGIPIIIDAAGAYGNQLPGKIADVVYSFHATKSFGAAEGGAVISGCVERIAKIRQLANFGIDTSTGLLTDHGTNGKMSEYHCAIGLASFDEWEETKKIRRSLYKLYLEKLKRLGDQISFQSKNIDGIYPLMPIALPRFADVHEIRARLSAAGIETRRWYSPSLHMHPALAKFSNGSGLSVAADLGQRIVGLPFFIGLSEGQISYICDQLAVALDQSPKVSK